MGKKVLWALAALAAFFIAACGNLQDMLHDPPRNLAFTASQLKADAATAGATAGSFSAEGGSGGLYYSLVEGADSDDNGSFTVESNLLKITAENLDEGEYYFRVRAVDGEGQSIEDSFTLKVGPPDESGEPENPDVPDVPGTPGGNNSGNSGEGGGPETPGGQTVDKPARAGSLASKLGMRMIELSWAAAARASSYEVYYSEGGNFSAAAKFALEPSEPAVTVTGLEDGMVYNFWVVAKNAGGSATESRMHTALRTSDGIPVYLLTGVTPGGPAAGYKASNYNDHYYFRDLGEAYPIHERYRFAYDTGTHLSHFGFLKFVRTFDAPPEQSRPGLNDSSGAGCLIYQYTNNGRQRFHAVYYDRAHLPPSVITDYQGNASHAPAAVMGTANGYASGMDASSPYTLEEAITKFAKRGGPPYGGGGMYDYLSGIAIYYGFDPDYIGSAEP